ncbi:MAG: HNH endonuclease [Thermodesulfobacteriota bacterium]|nr:HNH endonuclease [Thermodesulfobacteriota bacterium]
MSPKPPRHPDGDPWTQAALRAIAAAIIDLYDKTCFGCGAADRELHIDHVLPQSKGGDAAFRNLQPLCEGCGNEKGDSIPDEVKVFSDIYFCPYPSDGYEGLFW